MNSIPVITIDGFSGSGKSKLCQSLSQYLNWFSLESGVLYRILACLFLEQKNPMSKEYIIPLLKKLDQYFIYKNGYICKIMNKNFSNTYMISNSVTIIASKLATYKYIRKYLVNKQRLFRQPPGLVANGRDMGTVVFSDAIIKFFLEATLTNRVHRRLQEFKKKKYNYEFKNLFQDMKARDEQDQNRKHSPLKPAKDAIILNSNNMNCIEVVHMAIQYIKQHDYFKY